MRERVAAIYARASSEAQAQTHTIASQTAALRQRVGADGWHLTPEVQFKQKTVKHTPADKRTDAFIAILAGAHGLAEITIRVRAAKALQLAFGRQGCAEQSVVQETLDRCTPENVEQMHRALDEIFRARSLAYRHDYDVGLQLIDLDLTGLTCGPKAERATKGFFHHQGRYGRQMGRAVAALYGKVIVDRLCPGNVQLNTTLTDLVEAMEQTLDLDEPKRSRTVPDHQRPPC